MLYCRRKILNRYTNFTKLGASPVVSQRALTTNPSTWWAFLSEDGVNSKTRRTPPNSHARTPPPADTHAHTRLHTRTHTPACTHTSACRHARTHPPAHTHVHIRLHARTHLDEVGVLGVPDGDDCVHLLDQLLLLLVVEMHVPLGEARLPSAVLDQDEPDLKYTNLSFQDTSRLSVLFSLSEQVGGEF